MVSNKFYNKNTFVNIEVNDKTLLKEFVYKKIYKRVFGKSVKDCFVNNDEQTYYTKEELLDRHNYEGFGIFAKRNEYINNVDFWKRKIIIRDNKVYERPYVRINTVNKDVFLIKEFDYIEDAIEYGEKLKNELSFIEM